MKLRDKVALVTGANGGLGTFVTTAFLEAGARVVGVSKSIQASDFAHASFTAMPAEISNRESAEMLVNSAIARFGRIDALVHLVGGFVGGRAVEDTDDEMLEQMIDVNFRSAFHLIAAVLPGMRAQGSGRILAIGSRAAVRPQPLVGAYAASKAALLMLMATVAQENKSSGVSANVVLPSTMDTPANRAAMPGADYAKWVRPGQVAELLVHLASDEASQVSGAAIPIYGAEL